ncbi:energy transducer TonB [Rugosibacter aromaticivorans]|uniref:energy transducer TonB n=1 Tax=Rugosibacter aromaticivorans TaxID=1565605 RepID=UPI0012096FCA|nr:energy transducer TonB [Rugosibacter aromaticivorans]TBR14266.1 MAG: energy transducer TonB [Rugosibacter sp.]
MRALSLNHFSESSPQDISRLGMIVVLATHALVVFGLLRIKTVSLPTEPAVLSVSLLSPAEAAKPEPGIVPPHPKPVARKQVPIQQPAQLVVPSEAPVAASVAVPPAQTFVASTPPIDAPPASMPTQPRFDADYLDNPKPTYPPLSRRVGEQGRVVLRVRVGADGLANDVQLHISSGFARLDNSALETVQHWKFVPARRGNEAIAATVLIPIVFSLKG